METNESSSYRVRQLIVMLAQKNLIVDQKDLCKQTEIAEPSFSKALKKPNFSELYIQRIVNKFPFVNERFLRGDKDVKPFLVEVVDEEGNVNLVEEPVMEQDIISRMQAEIDRLKKEIDRLSREKDCDCCCRNIPIIPSRLVGQPDFDVLEHIESNIEAFDKVKVGNGLPTFDYFVRVVSSGLTDYVQKGDLLALRRIDDMSDLRWGLDAVVIDTKKIGMIPGFITLNDNGDYVLIPLDRKHPNTIIQCGEVLSVSKIIGLLRVGL